MSDLFFVIYGMMLLFLTAFYETLHDLARQWTGAEQLGDMVLGLAYEVRKALELQREQKDFGRFYS